MSQHVLIVAPAAIYEYHFETDLEIAERHLTAGDQVTMMVCHGNLLACDPNPLHDLGRCVRCIGRHRAGIPRLSGSVKVEPFIQLTDKDRRELRDLKTDWQSVQELNDFVVDNFDAGWAAQSSLAAQFMRPDYDVREQHDQIRRTLLSSVAAFRSLQNYLSRVHVDRLYVFNGRYATLRAVVRAAESKGVPFFVHERGSSFEKFALYENHPPFDIEFFQDEIRRAWDRANPEVRELVGTSFFADRVAGVQSDWFSYSARQEYGKLPETWKDGARNIVMYASSSDDLDCVREMVQGKTIYDNQYEAIDKIIASASAHPELNLFVRAHPRSASMPEVGMHRLLEMRLPNLTVIPAASPISTYAMMRKATRVVSFGSTTGMEATFWGTPSILGYRSYFDKLGCIHIPKSHDEMMSMIVRDQLPPADKKGALMYGHFIKTVGTPFRYHQSTGIVGGTFKDRPVRTPAVLRTAARILELPVVRDASRRLHLRIADAMLRRP
jgi:hypothetical protein